MCTFFISAAVLAVILPVFAAPNTNAPISKFAGPVKNNSYIIKLKDGISEDAHANKLISAFTTCGNGKNLDFIRQSSDVEYILEDGIMTIDYEIHWQGDEAAAFVAREAPAAQVEGLEKRANGVGVDVYGIDTGICTAHSSFGGRARWGATFGGYANQDGNGHGTDTSGTAVGASYGVATSANIIAVKVLSEPGSGTNSGVIAGINWAAIQARSSSRPSVNNAVAGGLHFAVAAGNSNVDAANTSPARVAAANTVGAVDSSNRKASFSNYASVLDVLTRSLALRWLPLLLLATLLSGLGIRTTPPAAISSALRAGARAVVTGAPSGTTNLLAQPF
ncbi:hypothetical protein OPQ81_008050 [Rhizoctonia solani]|nr:hypothetical protein OPQ81_008050 [Rhizoctonia solani]